MRKVKGPPAGVERTYVPRVGGDPIRVVIKNPTEADKRRIFSSLRTSVKLGADGKAELGPDGKPVVEVSLGDGEAWKREALKLCVVRIEDYTGTSGAPIVTGDDLAEHGETEIIEDVAAEIITGFSLTEEQKKTPARPSGSSSPATPAQGGTASSADASSSAAPADAMPPSTSLTLSSEGARSL